MSSGFVRIVVVNPPSVPATHCNRRWDELSGTILINWSKRLKNNTSIKKLFLSSKFLGPLLRWETEGRNPFGIGQLRMGSPPAMDLAEGQITHDWWKGNAVENNLIEPVFCIRYSVA